MSNKAIIRRILDGISDKTEMDYGITGLLVGLRKPFSPILSNDIVFCLDENDVRDLLREFIDEVNHFKENIWPHYVR